MNCPPLVLVKCASPKCNHKTWEYKGREPNGWEGGLCHQCAVLARMLRCESEAKP